MNWSNVFVLTIAGLIIVFVWLRSERRRRWLALLLVVLPFSYFICRWAAAAQQVVEALTGFGIALAAAGLWWLIYGRRLPPPSSDNIKVWGQDQ